MFQARKVDEKPAAVFESEKTDLSKFGPREGYTASWTTVMGVLFHGDWQKKEEIGRIVNGNVQATSTLGKCVRDLVLTREAAEYFGLEKENPFRNDNWVKGGLEWNPNGLDVKFLDKSNRRLSELRGAEREVKVDLIFREEPHVSLQLNLDLPDKMYHLLTDAEKPNLEAHVFPILPAVGTLRGQRREMPVSAFLYVDAVWMNGRKTKWNFGNVWASDGQGAFYYARVMQRGKGYWKNRTAAALVDPDGSPRKIWKDFKVEPDELPDSRKWKVSGEGLNVGMKADDGRYQDPVKSYGLGGLEVSEVYGRGTVFVPFESNYSGPAFGEFSTLRMRNALSGLGPIVQASLSKGRRVSYA